MGGIYFEYATTIIINRMLKFWMKVFWSQKHIIKFSETIERHLHSHMITDIWLYKKKEKGFTVSSRFTLLGKYTAPAPAPDG